MNHGTPNRLIQPLSVDVMRPVADGDCKDYALPTATTGLEARSHGTAKSKAQQRTEENSAVQCRGWPSASSWAGRWSTRCRDNCVSLQERLTA